jgi:hypothetical protein
MTPQRAERPSARSAAQSVVQSVAVSAVSAASAALAKAMARATARVSAVASVTASVAASVARMAARLAVLRTIPAVPWAKVGVALSVLLVLVAGGYGYRVLQSKPRAGPTLSVASVMPLLAGVPCSALRASVHDDVLHVQGYVPARVGTAGLQSTLAGVPGMQRLSLDVQPLADDKCDVIKTLAPYWLSNRQLLQPASIHTKAPNGQLSEGDPLVMDVRTPAFNSYVNIDYYALDGNVVHLVPSRRARNNQAPANYAATIGSLGEWAISKPFGSELIVLVVTPAPLFDTARPESEPRSDYLAALDRQLRQLTAKYGSDRVAADIVQIRTRPATH